VGSSENEIIQFIHPLSIRKINGIGRVMEKTLRGVLNIETVSDLYNKRADIHFLYKPASANFLLRASIGYSDDHHNSTTDNDDDNHDKNTTNEAMNRKGMSHERTFTPTSCWSTLCTNLEKIATCLANDLREKNLRPKTITLKVKLDTFDILTRAMTRDAALFQNCNQSESCQTLVDIAIGLLKEAKREHEQGGPATKKPKSANSVAQKTLKPFSIRLLGVRCSNFQLHDDMQQSLHRYGTATWGERDCVVQTRPTTPTHGTDSTARPVTKNPYLSPQSNSLQDNDSKMKQYEQTKSHGNERVKCPMCEVSFPNNDNGNSSLNAHIDECLNLATVKQLVNEETMCADEKVKNKKRRLTDFFAS
jgi:DNA polymerase kappa